MEECDWLRQSRTHPSPILWIDLGKVKLGTKDLTKADIYGPLGPDDKKAIQVPGIAASGDSAGWVEPVKGETLAFRTAGQPSDVSLVPLYKLFDERYTVYWKVNRKTA